MRNAECNSLPGLVKLFLVQAFCWLAGLFPVHIAFTLLQSERRFSVEWFLWSMVALVLSILAVAAITGMCTRSRWAAGVARAFCLAGILAAVAVCARLLAYLAASPGIYSHSSYSLFPSGALLPVSAVACVPVLAAWYVYFGSGAARSVFGLDVSVNRLTPPLGVGLLRVLCWTFIVTKLVLLLGFSLDAEAGTGTVLWRLSAAAWPGIVFPAAILWLVGKPGARLGPLLGLMGGWVLLAVISSTPALAQYLYIKDRFEPGPAYFFFSTYNLIPVPLAVLGGFLASLAWRFVAVPEEATWVAVPESVANAPCARLPLTSFLILCLCFSAVFYAVNGLAGALFAVPDERWFEVVLAVLAVLDIGLGIALVHTRLFAGHPLGRRWETAFFAAGAVYAAASLAFALHTLGAERDAWFMWFILPRFSVFLGMCLFGLFACRRSDPCAFRATPVAVGCFALFAACSAGGEALRELAGLCLRFFLDGADVLPYWDTGGANRTLNSGFWLAGFVCPAAVLVLIRKRIPSLGVLYAVCCVWLMGLFCRACGHAGKHGARRRGTHGGVADCPANRRARSRPVHVVLRGFAGTFPLARGRPDRAGVRGNWRQAFGPE